MTLSRDMFLKAAKGRRYIKVTTTFGEVLMQTIHETERVEGFDMWLRPEGELDDDRIKDQRLRLIILCAVDEGGNRLFQDDDLGILRETLSAADVSIMSDVAKALCGLGDADELLGKLTALPPRSNNSEPAPSACGN